MNTYFISFAFSRSNNLIGFSWVIRNANSLKEAADFLEMEDAVLKHCKNCPDGDPRKDAVAVSIMNWKKL